MTMAQILISYTVKLRLCAVYRLSSEIFPWCTEYEVEQLKDFDAIADELAFAGKLARAYDQRLTFHPSHFVKLAAETDDLLTKSIKELEVHSRVGLLRWECNLLPTEHAKTSALPVIGRSSSVCTERCMPLLVHGGL